MSLAEIKVGRCDAPRQVESVCLLLFPGQTASLTLEDKGEQKEADWISLGPRMLKWIRRLALGISVGVGWTWGAEKENEEVGNPQTTPFFLAEERRSNRVTFFWELKRNPARRVMLPPAPALVCRLFNFRSWKFIA